jgi:hypothetical protein
MLKTVTLGNNALTDLETAMDYLRAYTVDLVPHIARAVNQASARCEGYCQRKLKSRDWDLVLDGTGRNTIYLPHYPITDVASAGVNQFDGQAPRDLDLTAVIFDDAGLLYLPNDRFPKGTKNIAITATCGFLAGTHDEALQDLERACLRLTQVFYQDWANGAGRSTSKGVAGTQATWESVDLPDDVKLILNQYVVI